MTIPMTNYPPSTSTFHIATNRLRRRSIRQALTRLAWSHGCDITIYEERGWWFCAVRVTIMVPNDSLTDFRLRAISDWSIRRAAPLKIRDAAP